MQKARQCISLKRDISAKRSMTKTEFEGMIEHEISERNFQIVDFISKWHPSMPNTGKDEQIANLYRAFGMEIFRQMYEAAEYAKKISDEKEVLRVKLERLDSRMKMIKDGILAEERCRHDLEQMHQKAHSKEEWETLYGGIKGLYGAKLVEDAAEDLGLTPVFP